MLTYKIHFIKHGEAQGDHEGRYIGRTDVRLTQEGIQELEYLKEHYEYPRADMVVTSPLQRCIQTGDLLYPDTYMEQWEEFTECSFGEFEGKSIEELRNEEAFQKWVASGMVEPPPGGESSKELTLRVANGLNHLFSRMMNDHMRSVALILHGGIMTTMLYGMGLPKREIEECVVGCGRGFTVLMTPQLWMRDRAFEIYGIVPYGMTESELRIPYEKLGDTQHA